MHEPTPATRILLFGATGLLALLLDRLTKAWALATFAPGDATRWVVEGLLGFHLRFNHGASLSIGESVTWIFTLIGIVAVLAIPAFLRGGSRAWALLLGLVWGGALGNLADRLFAQPFGRGAVTDFIVYANWFTGNAADVFLVLGAIGLIALMAFGHAPVGGEDAHG